MKQGLSAALKRMFTYSAPTDEHKAKFERLTKHWEESAVLLDDICPTCPEKLLVFQALDVLRFHANACIVRGAYPISFAEHLAEAQRTDEVKMSEGKFDQYDRAEERAS